ncbi:non-ribosomal peptide synthetase [Streptomyces venezuelae]|uniref:non-ribosomal peptide synthetase n=1 Tax=Streptomyces venezuelae TaxID=54571 RepID=UPI001CCDC305|nr:non-ribosomal peptide synthetase [Streptomyces venezuelae]
MLFEPSPLRDSLRSDHLPPSGSGVRLPLSSSQREIWFSHVRYGHDVAHRIAEYVEIDGPVQVPLIEAAVRAAVAEAEPLNVRFGADAGGPWQVLDAVRGWEFPVLDVSRESHPRQVAERWMRGELRQPVNLEKGPLFSFALFRLGENRSALYHSYHHIAIDAAGGALVMRRIAELYSAMVDEVTAPEPSFGSLRLLLERDAAYQASPERAADRAYWAERLADCPEPARLGGPRQAAVASSVLRDIVHMTEEESVRLRGAARAAGVHWSVMLLATTAAYTYRLTGQSDIVIGLPVSARTDTELRGLPGMLANVVPVRLRVSADMRVRDLLRQVSRETRLALRHQRYRCVDLVRDLRLPEDGRDFIGPQVNIMPFGYDFTFASHPVTAHNLSTGVVDDLAVMAYDRSDGTGLCVDFNAASALYTATDLAGHRARFMRLLDAFCDGSSAERTVGGADMLSAEDARRVLVEWNDTAHEVPDLTLTELLTAQAERTPDRLAVIEDDGGRRMTYAELHASAHRLSRLLASRGAAPGQCVAVALPRSPDLMVTLLAVLITGAAYLPLDPEQPAQRLARMVSDAAPTLLVTRSDVSAVSALAGTDEVPRLLLDGREVTGFRPSGPPVSSPDTRAGHGTGPALGDPAYLIYTSGSTGQPKGVLVPHRAIVNRLLWMQDTYRLTDRDRVLQKTSIGFDVSVWELFWPLISGAALVLARPGGHRDPDYLAHAIRRQGVTTVHFVPSVLDAFLAGPDAGRCDGLRHVFSSGEALARATAERFHTLLPQAALHNLYGPTEAAVDVTHHPCVPGASGPVPIGRPVWNTRLYVLDAALQPCAPGMPGELYLAGVQLASGYHGRPELTADRFPADPFGHLFGAPGSRMYRTGDRARWLPDGSVEYLGRTDDQVKLHGVRIELGEVESALRALPGIAQAAASVVDEQLVGFVTESETGGGVHLAEARRRLTLALPGPMVPSDLVVVPTLPLQANGKLNRKALPALRPRPAATGPRPPRDAGEGQLAALFDEVLGTDGVSADADFFQLGGHSLLAIRLMARIREVFGTELPIRTLFEAPTVAQLAKQLQSPVSPRVPGRRGRPDGSADRLVPRPASSLERGGEWERRSEQLAPLLPLRAHGSAPPLFCVHPGSGLAGGYAGLLRHLGPARPVHALQALGLGAPSEPLPASVEEMAADYVRRIRAVRPSGPYHLLGWSFGGLVAHAMATRLQSEGERVGVLAVLDAYPDNRRVLSRQTALSERQWLRLLLDDVDHIEDVERVEGVVGLDGHPGRGVGDRPRLGFTSLPEQAGAARSAGTDTLRAALRPAGLSDQLLRDPATSTLLNVAGNNLNLLSRFTPGVFRGDLFLFTADEPVPGLPADPAHTPREWRRHVSGSVHVSGVAAHHFHLLHPGPLAQIGPPLAKALGDAEQRSGSG